MLRVRTAVVGIVLPLTLAGLTACGGDDTPTVSSAPTTTAAVPQEVVPTAPAPAPSDPSGAFDGKLIELTYANGEVSPKLGRVDVKEGTKVRITVTSDVVEEVHVHVYDLMVDLEPGVPNSVDFTATVKGVSEAELEKSGKLLFTLQTS